MKLYDTTLTRIKRDGTGESKYLATVKSIGPFGVNMNFPDMQAIADAVPASLAAALQRERGATGNNGLWYPSGKGGDEYNMSLHNTRGQVIARLRFVGRDA